MTEDGTRMGKGKIIFHSVTLPKKLKYGVMTDKKNEIKNKKYEIYVLYTQPKGSKPGCYCVKRKRLLIGNNKVADFSDGTGAVNVLTAKAMRTRFKKTLIDEPKFELAEVLKDGGFLSKKFWEHNLLWGQQPTIEQNLGRASDFIEANMPAQEISEAAIEKAARMLKYAPVSKKETTTSGMSNI